MARRRCRRSRGTSASQRQPPRGAVARFADLLPQRVDELPIGARVHVGLRVLSPVEVRPPHAVAVVPLESVLLVGEPALLPVRLGPGLQVPGAGPRCGHSQRAGGGGGIWRGFVGGDGATVMVAPTPPRRRPGSYGNSPTPLPQRSHSSSGPICTASHMKHSTITGSGAESASRSARLSSGRYGVRPGGSSSSTSRRSASAASFSFSYASSANRTPSDSTTGSIVSPFCRMYRTPRNTSSVPTARMVPKRLT
jgi:hypothetical protein